MNCFSCTQLTSEANFIKLHSTKTTPQPLSPTARVPSLSWHQCVEGPVSSAVTWVTHQALHFMACITSSCIVVQPASVQRSSASGWRASIAKACTLTSGFELAEASMCWLEIVRNQGTISGPMCSASVSGGIFFAEETAVPLVPVSTSIRLWMFSAVSAFA